MNEKFTRTEVPRVFETKKNKMMKDNFVMNIAHWTLIYSQIHY